jgi:hypothetical protein
MNYVRTTAQAQRIKCDKHLQAVQMSGVARAENERHYLAPSSEMMPGLERACSDANHIGKFQETWVLLLQ